MRAILTLSILAMLAGQATAVGIVTGADCEGGGIRVTTTVAGEVPPEWVGYIVARYADGACLDEFLLTPTMIPFTENLDVLDEPDVAGITYVYRAWAMDDQGERQPLGPVISTEMAAASCQGAVAMRGTFEDWGWAMFVMPCPENCWLGGFMEQWPEWIEPYADTGQVFDFYGDLYFGFEGPLLHCFHAEFANCEVVGTSQRTWTEVKRLYHDR